MNLYDLSINLKNLEEVLENCCDVPKELIIDSMNQIEGEINTKIENVIKWIKNLEGDTKALNDEIERLRVKKAVTENKINSLKLYLQYFVNTKDNKKYQTGIFNLAVRKNPDSVLIFDEVAIPKDFIKSEVKETIDKKAIKETLKSGTKVPGAELTNTESLIIK